MVNVSETMIMPIGHVDDEDDVMTTMRTAPASLFEAPLPEELERTELAYVSMFDDDGDDGRTSVIDATSGAWQPFAAEPEHPPLDDEERPSDVGLVLPPPPALPPPIPQPSQSQIEAEPASELESDTPIAVALPDVRPPARPDRTNRALRLVLAASVMSAALMLGGALAWRSLRGDTSGAQAALAAEPASGAEASPAPERTGTTTEATYEAPAPVAADPPAPVAEPVEQNARDGSDLLTYETYLVVSSTAEADVFVHGKNVGSTGEKVPVRCRTKNIRLRDPNSGQWLTKGMAVNLPCRTVHRMSIQPDA